VFARPDDDGVSALYLRRGVVFGGVFGVNVSLTTSGAITVPLRWRVFLYFSSSCFFGCVHP
jgi:hypothetical protein